MPRFRFKSKKDPVSIKSGVVEAATLPEAIEKVVAQGYTPLEVVPEDDALAQRLPGAARAGLMAGFGRRTVPLKVLGDFTRHLFDLADSGVPILRSLEILAQSTTHPALKAILLEMRVNIQAGESLSTAMARNPSVFPVYYIHMVRSGEASGQLPEIFGRLTQFIEKDLALRSKVMGSLMYPGMVFGVGVLTFFVLLTFVMPRLMALFEDFDSALPLPTQIVIGLSHFMGSFWWLVLVAAVVAWFLLARYAATASGRRVIDGAVLQAPVLRDFLRNTEMTRIVRTLGTLLEGGVPIAVALEAVVELTHNTLIKEELMSVARDVRGGSSLTHALKKAGAVWSESAVSMIAIGEETGKLEKGLFKLAASLERSTEESAAVFVTVLGPLALFFVVGSVGSMIVAMLLPLFQMNMLIN
jgi:type II secretory pathway component PulF